MERSDYTGREVIGETASRDVYTSDGDKLGRTVEQSTDLIVVEHGGLFGSSRYWIPVTAIASEDNESITLAQTKDDVKSQGWDVEPTDSGAYAASDAAYGSTGASAGASEIADTQDVGLQDAPLVSGAYGGTASSGGLSTQEQTSVSATASSQGAVLDDDHARVRLHEEELQARKVSHEAGEVTIGKEVVEETRTIEVPVRREELRIERHAATGEADSTDAFDDQTIRIPLREEDVEVRKVVRAVEDVDIQKVAVEETRTVQDTVRKERLDVDPEELVQGSTTQTVRSTDVETKTR